MVRLNLFCSCQQSACLRTIARILFLVLPVTRYPFKIRLENKSHGSILPLIYEGVSPWDLRLQHQWQGWNGTCSSPELVKPWNQTKLFFCCRNFSVSFVGLWEKDYFKEKCIFNSAEEWNSENGSIGSPVFNHCKCCKGVRGSQSHLTTPLGVGLPRRCHF